VLVLALALAWMSITLEHKSCTPFIAVEIVAVVVVVVVVVVANAIPRGCRSDPVLDDVYNDEA
jgi:membrane protein YdbS with pleckstrin-like domain